MNVSYKISTTRWFARDHYVTHSIRAGHEIVGGFKKKQTNKQINKRHMWKPLAHLQRSSSSAGVRAIKKCILH